MTTSKNITFGGNIKKIGPKYKKLNQLRICTTIANIQNFLTHMLYIIALKIKYRILYKLLKYIIERINKRNKSCKILKIKLLKYILEKFKLNEKYII